MYYFTFGILACTCFEKKHMYVFQHYNVVQGYTITRRKQQKYINKFIDK